MATPVRTRRLLPRFRPQTNVPDLPPGRWSVVEAPAELGKLEVPRDDDGGAFRTRVQSVPSPWARLFLFRDAMLDPSHPARALVENELLDALELAWICGPQSLRLETTRVRVPDLVGSEVTARVHGYAAALVDLAPRTPQHETREASALPVITLATVDGRPVFASSPYTVLFTAEDAAHEDYPYLFRYAAGQPARPLREREFSFQRYVATVVLPQMLAPRPGPSEHVDEDAVRRGVAKWLGDAVAEARRAAGPRQAELALPETPDAQLRKLSLRHAGEHAFAGVTLYTGAPDHLPSRWTLRTAAGSGPRPLVLVPGTFDGVYGEGLPRVELPAGVERIRDREVLPGTSHRRRWVLPEADWLADALVILSYPLHPEGAYGHGCYHPDSSVTQAPYAQPQIALPLKPDFFRWFQPAEVERWLRIDVPRPGEVRVTLTIPVGSEHPEEIRVTRRYTGAQIREDQGGPQLVVWPAFQADDWPHYAVFRLDPAGGPIHPSTTLRLKAFADGAELPDAGQAQRSGEASTYAFGRAPTVLALEADRGPGLPPQALGVLLPRYRPAPAPSAERWTVGVDFGTSNTVVATRRDGAQEPSVLQHDDLLLPVTRAGGDLPFNTDSFFFPEKISPEPFNSAVVHVSAIPSYTGAAREPVALRVNVPFAGWVKDDERNRVADDLKWSTNDREEFLASVFLRNVAALALAGAREAGVRPENVTFTYAYPRAFETDRLSDLQARWRGMLGTSDGGADAPAGPRLAAPLDEGQSALQYFLGRGSVTLAGDASVIMDVGGGTTDLAVYARGTALALDSLRWGGRDLVSSRVRQPGVTGFTNPFVRAFAEWAAHNGLPGSQLEPLLKFRKEGHDALALGYLLRSPWYRADGALRFRESPEYGAFRGAVLYFFAAAFHHTGLLLRALDAAHPGLRLDAVVLAGNGSRFLEWLQREWGETVSNPFRDALLAVLAAARGVRQAKAPRVVPSIAPKHEVALGLVAGIDAGRLALAPDARGSVVGESVRIERPGGEPARYTATSRIASHLKAAGDTISGIRWESGPMEIDRFHATLAAAAREHLAGVGGPWPAFPEHLEQALRGMGTEGIQQATRGRLERLLRETRGLPGSLFMVEAAAVLDHLMDAFFASYARGEG
ncbi:MAG TPA: hypothetical protein VF615_04005 [Longimicrobiaceae bacterium]|jgi:hypothetical protein